MAEKTEKATPKKLKDARKKGQVAKSQDFPSAFTFVVSIMATLFAAHYMFEVISSFILTCFKSVANERAITQKAPVLLYHTIDVIFRASAPVLIVVVFTGVLVNFLVIGPVFSFEAMKFQFKKLNPVEGIKQKFKMKVLVELIKSVLKIVAAALIIYIAIMSMLSQAVSAAAIPVYASAMILEEFLKTITIRVGIFFLLVALFDLAFQKKNFAKEMKMEKFEVKQEYKDTEGDPQIKGKRKELSREIAYQEGPSAARRARAIVTNPTHIAVAIGYNEEEDPAPMILTMGQGIIAEKIIKIAIDDKIPVMRNPELARDLFARGRISDYIPEDTYKAIAEVLKWVSSMEENPDVNMELFK